MEIDVAEIPPLAGFTGKERDVETGLDYFGARYYESWSARWLSVDPLANKYPGWSPYNYVEDNPTGSVIPNGKGWYETNSSNVPLYSPNINSQAELDKRVIGYTYLGQTTFTVNKQGDATFYNAKGSSGPGIFMAPTQTVTAVGAPKNSLRTISKIATSLDIPLETQRYLLDYAAKGADYLNSGRAFTYLTNGTDFLARSASYVNVSIAGYEFAKHPSLRSAADLGIELTGAFVPGAAIPVSILDITGLKHDLLTGVSDVKFKF